MSATTITDHSQRFANKSTEASISYANAGFFAGLSVLNVMFEAWSDAFQKAVETQSSRPKSWFRDPTKPDMLDPWSFWTSQMTALSAPWSQQNWGAQTGFPAWWMPASTTAPSAWAGFLPMFANTNDLSFTRNPFWTTATAALPMTMSLMSFGVPHAVAKPTAEGNAAALEAFDSAKQFANDQIEAYKTAMDPLPEATSSQTASDPIDAFTMLFWPWLSVPSETGSPAT